MEAADDRRPESDRGFYRRRANAIANGRGTDLGSDGYTERTLALHLRRVVDVASTLRRDQSRGDQLDEKMLQRRLNTDDKLREDLRRSDAGISDQLSSLLEQRYALFERVFSERHLNAHASVSADELLSADHDLAARPPAAWTDA